MSDAQLQIVIDALNKASDDLKKLKSDVEGVDESSKKADKSTEKFKGGLKDMLKTAAKTAAGFTAVGFALKKVYDVAKEGAQLEYAETKFDNLSKSIGTTADLLLTDLREATHGMYSDAKLMQSAGDFMALGLVKTHDEAVRLSTVAGDLNMNMNQLVLTLTNKTTMRFDALGVSVDGFDDKVKSLEASGLSVQDAFTEAFLQQAEEQIVKVGSAADEGVSTFMQFEAAIQNSTDAMKKSIAQSGLLETVLSSLTETLVNSATYQDLLDVAVEEGAMTNAEATRIAGDLHKGYLDLEDVIKLLTGAIDENRAEMHMANLDVGYLIDKWAMAGLTADEIRQKLIDLGFATEELDEVTENLGSTVDLARDALAKKGIKLAENQVLSDLLAIKSGELTLEEIAHREAVMNATQAYADGTITMTEYLEMLEEIDQMARNASGAIGGISAALDGLPREKRVQVIVDTYYSSGGGGSPVYTPPSYGGGSGGTQPGGSGPRATGGAVSAGNPYLWQEYGYKGEMMVPSQNGFVLSRSDAKQIISEAAAGGGGKTINFYLTANYDYQSPLTLVDQVKLLEASHV